MLEALWNKRIPPSISIQVLQELYVNVIKGGLSDKEAKGVIEDYLNWDVIENDSSLLLEGIKEKSRWKISFWGWFNYCGSETGKSIHYLE